MANYSHYWGKILLSAASSALLIMRFFSLDGENNYFWPVWAPSVFFQILSNHSFSSLLLFLLILISLRILVNNPGWLSADLQGSFCAPVFSQVLCPKNSSQLFVQGAQSDNCSPGGDNGAPCTAVVPLMSILMGSGEKASGDIKKGSFRCKCVQTQVH